MPKLVLRGLVRSASAASPPSIRSTSSWRKASSSRCSARPGCGKTTTLRMIAGFIAAERRHDRDGRPGAVLAAGGAAAGAAADVDDLPELRHLAEHDGGRECRLRPQAAQAAAGRSEAADRRDPRGRADGPPRRPLSGRAVRRPAAARRAGARDRDQAGRAAARRAAVQPRRQPARGDALRDPPPARRVPHHHRLRDARPGRGDGDLRPDRGDECRPHRAGRCAAHALYATEDPLRRRLHRAHQLHRGRATRMARSASTASRCPPPSSTARSPGRAARCCSRCGRRA